MYVRIIFQKHWEKADHLYYSLNLHITTLQNNNNFFAMDFVFAQQTFLRVTRNSSDIVLLYVCMTLFIHLFV